MNNIPDDKHNYTCPLCLRDLERDVHGNAALMIPPQQTMQLHLKRCVERHKAELLDRFCKEWEEHPVSVPVRLIEVAELIADWQKLQQIGKEQS